MKIETVKNLKDFLSKLSDKTKVVSETSIDVKFGETKIRSGKNFIAIMVHKPEEPINGW